MHQTIAVLLIIGSLLCWTALEATTPIRKCTENLPTPYRVQINDCEGDPCRLKAGSMVNMTIQFSPVNNTSSNLHAQVIAYVHGDSFSFEMPHDYADVCKHLSNNMNCPLKAGDNATYTLVLPLDTNLPDVYVETELAIVDDNTTCISCFVTDIRVLSHTHHHQNKA